MSSSTQLIGKLREISLAEKPLVRNVEHSLPETNLLSWKMSEHHYAKQPCPFPTLARGLFTTDDKIIVRGYDKFFNIAEVPWTTWGSIEKYTSGPYTLSYKENGCIIFIAATTASTIVVTSKHALGPSTQEGQLSHAEMGHKWLKYHLNKSGKTEEDLAKVLYENEWTAVSELCDDDFEEHVLGYPPERRGLHLHGLNKNIPAFSTEPFEIVSDFANQWGFIRTRSLTKNSIKEVEKFTADIEEQGGSIDGEPVEGFVVRCEINEKARKGIKDVPPYDPHSPFFFKIKFDEPYLMFREWREITRGLLARHSEGKTDDAGVRKATYPESVLYKEWTRAKIHSQPELFVNFAKSKGIIALREHFLQDLETQENKEKLENIRSTWKKKESTKKPKKPIGDSRPFGKTLLVPIAIPGCGKTAVSLALCKLYGFAHTQSDDVKTKKTGPTFEKNVVELLKGDTKVVIADRNNHMKQHRERLNLLPYEQKPPLERTRMIALYWPVDNLPINSLLRICSDRVAERGDRHQSLRADSHSALHEEIIMNFINQTQSFDAPSESFDGVIEMSIEDDLSESIKRVINGLRGLSIDLKSITQEDVEKVVEEVSFYNPDYRRPDELSSLKKKVGSGPRYFAIAVECKLNEICHNILKDSDEKALSLFNHLEQNDRIANVPHITLLHQKEIESTVSPLKEEYEECWKLLTTENLHIDFEFKVDELVYDDKVMALSLTELTVVGNVDASVKQKMEKLASSKVLHITVGTADSTINPFLSKSLILDYKNGKGQASGISIENVKLEGRLRGMF
ncbi:hypothetical protein E3Q11_03262 [Wallemia mellicola]|nr:hypothetical protein E3Q11_03262 [Wallemia mellicola]